MHLDWWTLALQTINFAILVWLLHRFLYRPVLRMIDARKAEVGRQFDDAKAAEAKAQDLLKSVEAARDGIAAERQAALDEAAQQAQDLADKRRRAAEKEAQAILEDGRKTLQREREQVLQEAQKSALDLAAAFARRLLSEVPAAFRQEAWLDRIEDHLKAMDASVRQALVEPLRSGESLAVVTAAPLPPPVAEMWRARIKTMLGDGFDITFLTDPNLVAGAELHFPTSILRFSWQHALATVQSEFAPRVDAR